MRNKVTRGKAGEFQLFLKQLELVLGKAKINLDIIDAKFNIRYIDPSWQKIHGSPSGRKCYQYFMGESKVCPDCAVVKALATKKMTVTERTLVKEGNRPVRVTIIPFKDGQDEWLVAEVNIDITECKRAEDVLKRDREALERLVGDRTNEMLSVERELDRSRRLADIGSLAATIAHELRNPLGAIRTAAYNIKKKSQNPLLYSHLSNIEKKVLECDQIINNLLFYSHIRAPKFEKLRICGVVDECIADSKTRFPEYDVLITRESKCPKEFFVAADPLQIREVFTNILNNAYESLERKIGKLTISDEVDKNGYFKIIFKDNGIGITSADLKRVFEPFFTKKAKGTGLGLVVCRQIITLHNGEIEIKSRPAKGATVSILLPAYRNR